MALVFDGWIIRLLKSSGLQGETLVVLTGIHALEPCYKHNSARMHGKGKEMDLHVWHSIPNAKTYLNNVRDAMIQVNIRNAEFYRVSAETYISELDQLDRHLRALIATLDMPQRKMITNQDVFRYLE